MTFPPVFHAQPKSAPRCVIIAGPNGAGKTTFAREFLPKDSGILRFVNADLIADGLSPLHPELAALHAGRIFLAELDRLVKERADFAFETTLSGRTRCATKRCAQALQAWLGEFRNPIPTLDR